jgi:plastocyanin
MMKKNVVFPFLALLAVLLVACGGGATLEPVSHTIEMTEYAFTPATLELKVGQQVTLNLVNRRQISMSHVRP